MPSPTHPPTDTGAIGAERSEADGGIGYDAGSILWHCSEEDGGPDVGIQLGLGGGCSLYFGEISTATLTDYGIDLKVFPDGWWIVLYSPRGPWVIGAVPDHYHAIEAMDDLAARVKALLAQAPSPATTPTGVLETSLIVEGSSVATSSGGSGA